MDSIINILKYPVIVIDPDEKKAEKIRKMLEKSMKNVAIINTRCLFHRHKEIDNLVRNENYFKIIYGCSEKFFNEMVEKFKLRGAIKHIGWRLDISKIVICYWKQKNFQLFP